MLCDKGAYPEADGAKLYTSGMLRTEQTFEHIYRALICRYFRSQRLELAYLR